VFYTFPGDGVRLSADKTMGLVATGISEEISSKSERTSYAIHRNLLNDRKNFRIKPIRRILYEYFRCTVN